MKLHNYQQRCVDFMMKTKRGILSVGMGLGKTAASIHYLNKYPKCSFLIVAPKRVALTVWKQEAKKWGLMDLYDRMEIVSGSPKIRAEIIKNRKSNSGLIISRDLLKDVEGLLFDILIIDELTSFKNVMAQRTQNLLTIKTRQTIGLTGTFLANGAIDIYGQCAACGIFSGDIKTFKGGKYKVCQGFDDWQNKYFYDKLANAKLKFHKWVLKENVDTVINPIRDKIFTLDSADYLEIPEVTTINHSVILSKSEQKVYDEMNSFLFSEMDGEMVTIDEEAKFMKLQTLCNGFIYRQNEDETITTIRGKKSSKLEAVADFITSAVAEGERVLLFYAFKEEAVWLGELLTQNKIKYCSVKKDGFVELWENGDIDVLFAHPASAGHGLNLQYGGRIIVWSSVTYNYELWAQGNARLARQGQKNKVIINVFTTQNTIEGKQLIALEQKNIQQQEFLNNTKK